MRRPWEGDGDPPWPVEEWEPVEGDWRGELHVEGWPEGQAGAEYWLFKRDQRDEEAGNG